MSSLISGRDALNRICTALGLTSGRICRLEIVVGVHEAPTVKVWEILRRDKIESLEAVLTEYVLSGKPDVE